VLTQNTHPGRLLVKSHIHYPLQLSAAYYVVTSGMHALMLRRPGNAVISMTLSALYTATATSETDPGVAASGVESTLQTSGRGAPEQSLAVARSSTAPRQLAIHKSVFRPRFQFFALMFSHHPAQHFLGDESIDILNPLSRTAPVSIRADVDLHRLDFFFTRPPYLSLSGTYMKRETCPWTGAD
jgi:hypothetical protein